MPEDNPVDIAFIRQLAEIIADGAVGEIEIKHDDLKIRMSRETARVAAPAHVPPPVAPVAQATVSAAPASARPVEPESSAPAAEGEAVPSPMVGTAYIASAPGAEPYARVGDKVSKGQTIMIVEAMKTMNQIPAPRDGTIVSISVEDGQPVEYGETLLTLE